MYQHPRLAAALGWKFNHQPGICTADGTLTAWPSKPWPTESEQAQAVAEYEAYLASDTSKDDDLQRTLDSAGGRLAKVLATLLIEKGVCSLAELRAIYRRLA